MTRFPLAALIAGLLASPAAAAELVTIKVGYSAGGSFDLVARTVADHLGRHLPGNPEVIVENVPGAGSLKLAKLFTETGATDGSEIAMIGSSLALLPIFEPDAPGFDPRKVRYLASLENEASFCVSPKTSGIESFTELLQSDAKVGATGKASTTYTFPAAIKAALGAKFDIVVGFEGGAEINVAMERGELQARCGLSTSAFSNDTPLDLYNVLAEMHPFPSGQTYGGDFVLDLIPDASARAAVQLVFSPNLVHNPMLMPLGTPDDIVETYRNAIEATVRDPAFLADVEMRGVHFVYTSGEETEQIIRQLLASDAEVQALARSFVQ